MAILEQFAQDDFCYLTTTGRVSGKPHTIEIWFALNGSVLYLLAGGREKSDWVKNIEHNPQISLKLRETQFSGQGRIVAADTEEDALARRLVAEKYIPRSSDDLSDWSRTSLPVAIDLVVE